MKLVIAEKKVLADQILTAIGASVNRINKFTCQCADFTVTFLGGHILTHLDPQEIDEKYKEWKIEDLPIYFPVWKKKVIEGKRELFDNVASLLQRTQTVIHAGDMDDEGQLLVDEVLEYCNYKGQVLRLNTADTTPKTLRNSLKNLKENNVLNGFSAEARSLSDQVFGFTLSRYFSLRTGIKCNIGRVKCPTLGLVVKRDEMIDSFVETTYYTPYFKAKCASGEVKVKTVFSDEDDILDYNGYLSNKANAIDFVKSHNNNVYEGTLDNTRETDKVPLPFNLANLQLACEKKFGYTPSETLEITQSLRDKYNAISYNRSECEYLPESYYEDSFSLRSQISKNLAIDNPCSLTLAKAFAVSYKDNFRADCFNDKKVSLHFAIVPQDVSVDLTKLTEQERNVYIEICRRYLMQFCGNAIKDKDTLTIKLEKKRKAVATSIHYVDLGWKKLIENRKLSEEETTVFPFVDPIRDYTLFDGYLSEGKTKPPKRYSEASLIADMCIISKYVTNPKIKALLLEKDEDKTGDKGSIGTSATRDTIVRELIEGKYLEKTGKNLKTTAKGKALYYMLPDVCKTPDITANWFLQQQAISKGESPLRSLPEMVRDETVTVMEDNFINFGQFAKTLDESSSCGSCKCGGVIKETKFAWYCTKCKSVVSKEDKFLTSLGIKINKKNAVTILSKHSLTAQAYSKKKEKEYTAVLDIQFLDEKKNNKGFIYPSYSFNQEKTKRSY